MQGSFAVRAILRSGTTQQIRVGHIEIRSNSHLWLASPSGAMVSDPFVAVSSTDRNGARVALDGWIQWSGLLPNGLIGFASTEP